MVTQQLDAFAVGAHVADPQPRGGSHVDQPEIGPAQQLDVIAKTQHRRYHHALQEITAILHDGPVFLFCDPLFQGPPLRFRDGEGLYGL